ncbi:MAG: hypothetical protein NC548_19540 [Lachnospiraceae bacterium]|nr:hypothetical protein [Lachnospiraceae bacterium]
MGFPGLPVCPGKFFSMRHPAISIHPLFLPMSKKNPMACMKKMHGPHSGFWFCIIKSIWSEFWKSKGYRGKVFLKNVEFWGKNPGSGIWGRVFV